MKMRAFILSFIAFIILTGFPFGLLLNILAHSHGKLVCYCCKTEKTTCAVISCDCCQDKASPGAGQSVPEIIFDPHYPTVSFTSVFTLPMNCIMPESIYADVPVKPPNPFPQQIAPG